MRQHKMNSFGCCAIGNQIFVSVILDGTLPMMFAVRETEAVEFCYY
jgi:hypothetical protein